MTAAARSCRGTFPPCLPLISASLNNNRALNMHGIIYLVGLVVVVLVILSLFGLR